MNDQEHVETAEVAVTEPVSGSDGVESVESVSADSEPYEAPESDGGSDGGEASPPDDGPADPGAALLCGAHGHPLEARPGRRFRWACASSKRDGADCFKAL